jgi:hypothetical protein
MAPSTTEAKPHEPAPQESVAHTAFVDRSEARHQNGTSADTPGPADTSPPVFNRPASASPESGGGLDAEPVYADLGRFPSKRRIVFPLPEEYLSPKDRGEEPEDEGPEDPLLPGEQISPGEDQYAPVTGDPDARSDTETTAE